MAEKALGLTFEHWRIHGQQTLGLIFDWDCSWGGEPGWRIALYIPGHTWDLNYRKEEEEPCLAKPSKPKWWQGLLCIVVCLALQAFLWALELRV